MRNYHIINVAETVVDLPGYQKVLTTGIDQIVNHSADRIYCTFTEYQDKKDLKQLVSNVLSKLKPKAQVMIEFVNFKKVCEDFLNSKISSSQIFELIKGKKEIVMIEDIIANLDVNTYKIMNINYDNYNISITIERTLV